MRARRSVMLLSVVVLSWALFGESLEQRTRATERHADANMPMVQRGDAHAHAASAQNKVTTDSLPLAVDGSKNPEQVPDRIAYYHFIQSHAQNAKATESDRRRLAIRLKHLGLSPEDYASLETLLSEVKPDLDIANSMQRGASPDPVGAKLHRDRALDLARETLNNMLSLDGKARVTQFVRERVKPGIKIYGQVRPE